MARLEGDLELSRAFGDLRYRHKGLIAIPEVHGPRPLDKGVHVMQPPSSERLSGIAAWPCRHGLAVY